MPKLGADDVCSVAVLQQHVPLILDGLRAHDLRATFARHWDVFLLPRDATGRLGPES